MKINDHESDVVVGIDLGTTGVKVICLDPRTSATVSSAAIEYPSSSPAKGAHEQDPADWWDAVVRTTRLALDRLGSRDIRAIGLSGHMHSLVLVDDEGIPVAPAMTWADRRVGEDTQRLTVDGRFHNMTGNEVVDAFTAPKLSWLSRTAPELLGRARRLILSKDYVGFRLTGNWTTDETDAIGTLLYDVHRREWRQELWEAAGGSIELAPPVIASTEAVGTITSAAAAATGLPEGTPVIAGAGDVSSAVLGTGTVARDQICINAGTAAQVMGLSEHPKAGPGFLFGAATGRDFIIMASLYAAGASVKWAEKALLAGGDINVVAEDAAPGASGLVYLPFMFGSTVPRKNDAARAAFIGQTERHGRQELARAVLEGVAFACADAVSAVASVVGNPREVRVVGGVANSAIWRETLTAVLGSPVVHMSEGGSARGAAILAGLGTGIWPDAATATASFAGTSVNPPDDEHRVGYLHSYRLYREACERLI